MYCIKCQQKTQVTNSRTTEANASIWRRRSCLACRFVFTTYESLASNQLKVSGEQNEQAFSQPRLLLSLAACFEHKPEKKAENAQQLSQTIVRKLIIKHGDKFNLRDITLMTFETLKNFDRLAAVQYSARHSDVLEKKLRHL